MPMLQPDPDALAHGATLARRIADRIRAQGGWLGFEAWMASALYEPGLGYYAGARAPFGPGGDFVTAPELTPLFAECVAVQISQWFGSVDPVVVEFGAGSGRLAAGVLEALERAGTPVRRYRIVEVSGTLRALQRETLGRRVPALLDRVEWLDALPASIEGVVLGNEVLDAMPVRVFEQVDGTLYELGVVVAGEADGAPAFDWAARPADARLRAAVADALRAAGGPADDPFTLLGPGRYRSEIGEQASAWIGTVGRSLRRGAMLLLDYGFPAREFYHPQRDGGTLIAHRRHHAHAEVLRWPGLQDVTAHVDFSAIARAASAAGLDGLGYASQARFLLNCGMLERAAGFARPAGEGGGACDSVGRVRALGAVQTLLSEAEMGELFKAIAFGRGMPDDAIGFARGDRTPSL
jgi:SAM-dependent MidA family methyltransferase